jgi:hypothetical protein
MKIEQKKSPSRTYVLVHVDANELVCDGGRTLPYPCCVGTIGLKGHHQTPGALNVVAWDAIDVWTPAAPLRRGYKAAATRLLEEVRQSIIAGTAVIVDGGLQ